MFSQRFHAPTNLSPSLPFSNPASYLDHSPLTSHPASFHLPMPNRLGFSLLAPCSWLLYPPHMRAEIISVGTEILLGEITDTNSQYLASRLPAIGIDLYHQSTVGDNLARLSEAIERGVGRSDVLLITGGLGPTDDDLTREAIR